MSKQSNIYIQFSNEMFKQEKICSFQFLLTHLCFHSSQTMLVWQSSLYPEVTIPPVLYSTILQEQSTSPSPSPWKLSDWL